MDKRIVSGLCTATVLLATAHAAPAGATPSGTTPGVAAPAPTLPANPLAGGALLASTRSVTVALDPRSGRVIRQIAAGADAVVSARARRIAFTRDIDPCNPDPAPDGGGCQTGADLLTSRLDGSGRRAVVHDPTTRGSVRDPDWSADGRQLVFHWGSRGELGLAIVNADGTGFRGLVGGASGGTYSPDGRQIAYQHGGDVHVLDVATGESRPVSAEGLAQPYPPDWSPDGRHLVYAGEHEFLVVPAAGGPSVGSGQWGPRVQRLTAPVFSPDGRRVAFAATDESALDGPSARRVYVADRDGGGLTAVAEGDYRLTDWLGR